MTTSCQSRFPLAAQSRRVRCLLTSPAKTRVRGFAPWGSGRLSRRGRRRREIAVGLRACGYKTASGRAKWPNRDPLSEEAFFQSYSLIDSTRDSALAEEALSPLYVFARNDGINRFDKTGLDADITWSPAPCGKGLIMSFIQVGRGGWFRYKDPFVDDGSAGFGAKGTGCPEYPDFGHPGIFEDSPGGATGPVSFVVCRVCIEPCCNNKRSIVSVGPCKAWKKGDKGDLGAPEFVQTPGPPGMWWVLAVKKKYPNALSPDNCYSCKNPSGK